MSFIKALLLTATSLLFGAVQAAPVARLIINSDPGESVGGGGFHDVVIDDETDGSNLRGYPLNWVAPMTGFSYNFWSNSLSKAGGIEIHGMTPGDSSSAGSLGFDGAGCNANYFSSQTHEAKVSGFQVMRFVATFRQSCADSPFDHLTYAQGVFVYDSSGDLAIPDYLADSAVLVRNPAPSIPEPEAILLTSVGVLAVVMNRRRDRSSRA